MPESETEVATDVNYWMITDKVFRKRGNLTGDKAVWTGWICHARTAEEDFVACILRRKFIPPLMDTAHDISITGKGPALTCNVLKVVTKAADNCFCESQQHDVYENVI